MHTRKAVERRAEKPSVDIAAAMIPPELPSPLEGAHAQWGHARSAGGDADLWVAAGAARRGQP